MSANESNKRNVSDCLHAIKVSTHTNYLNMFLKNVSTELYSKWAHIIYCAVLKSRVIFN
jgi:hypothetical protein